MSIVLVFRLCSSKPPGVILGKRIQSSASMLIYSDPIASTELKRILATMKVDSVSMCVKNDMLIVKYGNVLCRKLRKEGGQQYHISNKMRELARFVLEARQCCSDIPCLKDYLNPAATELSGWNEEDGTLACPSIGIKLGHSLKKCAKLLKCETIIGGQARLKAQADYFTALVEIKWNDEIGRTARTELRQRKWNKPALPPLTSDLKILRKHSKKVSDCAITALSVNNNDTIEWRNLATSILTNLILFNRRRAGEPALLTLDEFQKGLTNTPVINDEVKQSL